VSARLPRVTVRMTVNGTARAVTVPPMKRLLDVLREDCGLTGTKEGCGEGECGACTVRLDGRSVNSCLVPAIHADGAKILTVEGLDRGAALSALQRAFVVMGGAQCGICTPGILVSASELLSARPGRVPSEDEVREALAGNLCRCTGYQKIVDAVRAAARETGGERRAKPAPRKATTKRGVAKQPVAAKKAKAATKAKAAKRPKLAKKRAALAPRRATRVRRGATRGSR